MEIHAEILVKDGKKIAVIPYEEFIALQERLADADDLLGLRHARETEGDAPAIPLNDVRRELLGNSE